MWRWLFLFCLMPGAASVQAQPTNDEAAQQAINAKWGPYAPKRWRVIMAETGSLFAPGSDDAVLVVEDTDPANIVANEGMGEPQLNTNRRWLLILTGSGGTYEIRGQIEDFLPSAGDPESPCLADPLMEGPGIAIDKRVLSIGLQYWYSCGSWYVNRNTLKFRAEGERLRLIGRESWSFHRGGGMGNRTSVNYLTGRKQHVENAPDIGPQPDAEVGDDVPKPVERWSRANRRPVYFDCMRREQCSGERAGPDWCGGD